MTAQHPRVDRLGQAPPRDRHLRLVAELGGAAEQPQPLARLELDDVAMQRPDPQLRSRQVLKDRNLASDLVGRGADPLGVLGVELATAVREVEPGDVHPGLDQSHQRLRIA
jgi:hypothetical protein